MILHAHFKTGYSKKISVFAQGIPAIAANKRLEWIVRRLHAGIPG